MVTRGRRREVPANEGLNNVGRIRKSWGRGLEGAFLRRCFLQSVELNLTTLVIHSTQLKIYQMGEGLVDRIDFEEFALKGLDPSLGPSLVRSSPEIEKTPRVSDYLAIL